MINLNDVIGGKLSENAKRNVSTILFTWVVDRARKAPVQDLDTRLKDMKKGIDSMAESLELEVVDGKVVVKVLGQGDTAFRQLKNGTKWFDPMPDVNGMIVVAALSS